MTDVFPDVVEFLLARLDEREQGRWLVHDLECEIHATDAGGIVAQVEKLATLSAWCDCAEPETIRRDVEANRKLIERGDTLFCDCDQRDGPPMDPASNWTKPIPHHYDCTAYRIAQVLAESFASHPEYREEWRP